MICSGVGPTGLDGSSSLGSSAGTSPGTNVLTDSFLASSSASFDANNLAASSRSYQWQQNIRNNLFKYKLNSRKHTNQISKQR